METNYLKIDQTKLKQLEIRRIFINFINNIGYFLEEYYTKSNSIMKRRGFSGYKIAEFDFIEDSIIVRTNESNFEELKSLLHLFANTNKILVGLKIQ